MSFNTLEFALFFPLVLILLSSVVHRPTLRNILLIGASYLFYMAWYWEYAGLLAMSTVVDYYLGQVMGKTKSSRRRKQLIVLSLVLNLGQLAVFKYFNFFVDLSTNVVDLFGWSFELPRNRLLLPIGISFYTFQSLSYTIDVYRKSIEPEKNFLRFAAFVSFFPQLVAGPIVRASDFLPQLHRPVTVNAGQFHTGLTLFFIGLFKKVILADMLALLVVDEVFKAPQNFSSWDLLIGIYAYAFQIYGDFSGYSDMAIGCAAMMGFWLPINFNRPYLSQNIREFWTRWHISLSTWLKDYLYISLGGNREGKRKTQRNLLVTMLLGGLWHGAALNFLLWGAWHGALLSLARAADRHAKPLPGWKIWWKRLVTFHLVCFGWLLFRVSSGSQFMAYLSGLAKVSLGTSLHVYAYALLFVAFAIHIIPKDFMEKKFWEPFKRAPIWVRALFFACIIILAIGFTLDSPAFIYFQF